MKYIERNGVAYIPVKEIKGNKDLHKIARKIKYESGTYLPETTTRKQFLQEIKSEIEWYMEFVVPPVSKATLEKCYQELLKIEERDEQMDKIDINKVLAEIKELLKNSKDYKDMEICYVLEDKRDKSNSIIVAMHNDDIIEINPFTKEVNDIADWAYNIDDDVFAMLESDKKISYMSMNMHYGIWQTIEQWYPEDLEHKKGMQKYLKYCKDNKITKDVIEKETKLDKLPNAMKYYKKEKNKER